MQVLPKAQNLQGSLTTCCEHFTKHDTSALCPLITRTGDEHSSRDRRRKAAKRGSATTTAARKLVDYLLCNLSRVSLRHAQRPNRTDRCGLLSDTQPGVDSCEISSLRSRFGEAHKRRKRAKECLCTNPCGYTTCSQVYLIGRLLLVQSAMQRNQRACRIGLGPPRRIFLTHGRHGKSRRNHPRREAEVSAFLAIWRPSRGYVVAIQPQLRECLTTKERNA